MPKKPFSGKAKKAQLQAKRERKAGGSVGEVSRNLNLLMTVKNDGEEEVTKVEEDLTSSSKSSRYKLKFKVESKKELAESREKSQQKISKVEDQSATTEMYFDSYHDFPVRQTWKEDWSKQRLEMTEQKYFREYVDEIMSKVKDEDSPECYSYFELNLETWRQLWRVIELSDIILMVVDVRFVTATFPPALYHYIVKEKQKHFILVLNKCDLVEPELPAAWKHYLEEKFPELFVVFFTSYPSYNSIRQGDLRYHNNNNLIIMFSLVPEDMV